MVTSSDRDILRQTVAYWNQVPLLSVTIPLSVLLRPTVDVRMVLYEGFHSVTCNRNTHTHSWFACLRAKNGCVLSSHGESWACEKYLQHQQDLFHVFIDFKKAFDKVWNAALWATMKKYIISTNLIQVIKNLYNKATSAVLFNGSIGDWFRTTVGVRQGCLLSPTLFNIFLEKIMTDALEDHEGTVSIGG